MEDTLIIELYFQRNEKAIQETDKVYGNYCYKIADNILNNHDDSCECVNDTWLHTWNSIPPGKPNCLKLFLAKITRNLAFDYVRRNNAKKRGGDEVNLVLDELSEHISSRFTVEHEIEYKELVNAINAFLGTISKRDRCIFLRRYFYVEDVTVISKKYGISKQNILMILSRTRKKLKKYLEKEAYTI